MNFDKEKAMAFGLTRQESAVLSIRCTGKNTKEIAQQLNLSQNTVQEYLKHIREKTQNHDIVGVMLWVFKNKILTL